MNPQIRRSPTPILLVLGLLGASLPPIAAAQIQQPESRRTISVQGRAEISVPADRAIVTVAVETVHKQAQAAVADNAERSASTTKAVQSLLGPGDKVTTTRYSLQPRYEHVQGHSEPRISGYVASNEVRVETAALESVGKIVDAAIRAGANRIGSLQFTIAERDEPSRRALELAGQRARRQAETIAESLGIQLGEVISASSSESAPIVPMKMEMMAMARADMVADTPIEAGDVTVSADVHVVFAIE